MDERICEKCAWYLNGNDDLCKVCKNEDYKHYDPYYVLYDVDLYENEIDRHLDDYSYDEKCLTCKNTDNKKLCDARDLCIKWVGNYKIYTLWQERDLKKKKIKTLAKYTKKKEIKQDFEVYFSEQVAAEIALLTLSFGNSEIGGLIIGKKTYDDGKLMKILITELVIIKQSVTSGSVDYEKDALEDYGISNIEMIKAPTKPFEKESIIGTWHSHGSMSTFISGTDKSTIDLFLKMGWPAVLSVVTSFTENMNFTTMKSHVQIDYPGDVHKKCKEIKFYGDPDSMMNDPKVIEFVEKVKTMIKKSYSSRSLKKCAVKNDNYAMKPGEIIIEGNDKYLVKIDGIYEWIDKKDVVVAKSDYHNYYNVNKRSYIIKKSRKRINYYS
ncbi:MAG: hypothetical protein ACTSRA_00540 [Promethearchaeota archaeon]